MKKFYWTELCRISLFSTGFETELNLIINRQPCNHHLLFYYLFIYLFIYLLLLLLLSFIVLLLFIIKDRIEQKRFDYRVGALCLPRENGD